MAAWGNICRICTSPADYDIFEKIPAYLHTTSNEFLNWQKPINVLLEETTGLKFSRDDALPNKICALCISYLKHAATFRDQCINNTLGLKAVSVLRQQNRKCKTKKSAKDKESLLITAQELEFSDERQIDTNLLTTNGQQDQDKVCKQLLNNSFQTSTQAQENMEQQLRYLNLLFGKDTKPGTNNRQSSNNAAIQYDVAVGGDPYADDFQTATSSEDNEVGAMSQKHIFSYREKNFEEDDIMDEVELRNAITINMPESCKERKCRACFRRFMFEESFNEHMNSCIEYRFLIFIEEINRLLDIRRNKAVSPHEFIRRMIFCLRKTCEWLQKANCGDMLLPGLFQKGITGENGNKLPMESEGKSSTTSSFEQKQPKVAEILNENLHESDNMTDLLIRVTPKIENRNGLIATNLLLNIEDNEQSNSTSYNILKRPNGTTTPITVDNNILYQINRSLSSNSNKQCNAEEFTENRQQVKKPIALLAKGTATKTSINAGPLNNNSENLDTERITFLKKLHQATTEMRHSATKSLHSTPTTPLISVRKDLLPNTQYIIPDTQQMPPASIMPIQRMNLSFSARCNPCNLLFETLASLEVHNAMNHNDLPPQAMPKLPTSQEAFYEHKRIIALFEEDEEDFA